MKSAEGPWLSLHPNKKVLCPLSAGDGCPGLHPGKANALLLIQYDRLALPTIEIRFISLSWAEPGRL